MASGGSPYGEVVWEGNGLIHIESSLITAHFIYSNEKYGEYPIVNAMYIVGMEDGINLTFKNSPLQNWVLLANGQIFRQMDTQKYVAFVEANNGSDAHLILYSGQT